MDNIEEFAVNFITVRFGTLSLTRMKTTPTFSHFHELHVKHNNAILCGETVRCSAQIPLLFELCWFSTDIFVIFFLAKRGVMLVS